MRVTIEPPPEPGAPLPPLWRRLMWFGGLSAAAALSTAGLAYALKLLLR